MGDVKNPIVGYADSYRLMQRDGAKKIDIWSIITDLERNMIPAVEAELAALREELAIIKDECIDHVNLHKAWTKERDDMQQRLTAAEQRNSAVHILSPEAYSTVIGMVEHCLNVRACMGMDEGFKDFDTEEEHDFVKEIRAFVSAALKRTESGASDKCASDGGTCGLGGHCGECPHVESGASDRAIRDLANDIIDGALSGASE